MSQATVDNLAQTVAIQARRIERLEREVEDRTNEARLARTEADAAYRKLDAASAAGQRLMEEVEALKAAQAKLAEDLAEARRNLPTPMLIGQPEWIRNLSVQDIVVSDPPHPDAKPAPKLRPEERIA